MASYYEKLEGLRAMRQSALHAASIDELRQIVVKLIDGEIDTVKSIVGQWSDDDLPEVPTAALSVAAG